jgi:GxxExxY protein
MTAPQQPNAKGAKVTQRTQRTQSEEILSLDCTREIIGAAVEVQRVLGVGLLESAYAAALEVELAHAGLNFRREVPIYGRYKSLDIGLLYRADFIVESSVVLEIKALEATSEAHRAQLLSYLRVSGHRIGLLINFHSHPVSKGIHRLVNNL